MLPSVQVFLRIRALHTHMTKRQLLGLALACLLLVVALHHVESHGGGTGSGEPCPLCVLLASALLAPVAVVAMVCLPQYTLLRAQPGIPALGPETWTARSHRGPPLSHS
jgi:disulfide bond formation protein DsbB